MPTAATLSAQPSSTPDTPQSTTSTTAANVKLARVLVVDASPFIKNTRLDLLADEIFTIPDVIKEIRDKTARENYEAQRLIYPINLKTPSEEAMAQVTAFSKKTGDFAALSLTDLRLLALTWMMEKERNGIQHIRTEPKKALQVTPHASASSSKSTKPEVQSDFSTKETPSTRETESIDPCNETNSDILLDSEPQSITSINSIENNIEAATPIPSVSQNSDQDTLEVKFAESCKVSESSTTSKMNHTANDSTVGIEDGGEDDGEGEWITPSNIVKMKAKHAGNKQSGNEKKKSIPVACITSDYAIQNVLLQMNLKLVSVDGFVIKKTKSWVLRCHACYKVTSDMEKKFCPSCGNNTLIRTSVGVDAQGNVKYYLKKNFQYNLRGTKYSIPTPKGGRNNSDLILREDQREYELALKNQRRKKTDDPFDLDYIPLESVAGKGLFAPRIGNGRKNPNEVRGRRR